jgi:hypothetical protein
MPAPTRKNVSRMTDRSPQTPGRFLNKAAAKCSQIISQPVSHNPATRVRLSLVTEAKAQIKSPAAATSGIPPQFKKSPFFLSFF